MNTREERTAGCARQEVRQKKPDALITVSSEQSLTPFTNTREVLAALPHRLHLFSLKDAANAVAFLTKRMLSSGRLLALLAVHKASSSKPDTNVVTYEPTLAQFLLLSLLLHVGIATPLTATLDARSNRLAGEKRKMSHSSGRPTM